MRGLCAAVVSAACLAPGLLAQQTFTWQEIKEKFESANPALRAAQ